MKCNLQLVFLLQGFVLKKSAKKVESVIGVGLYTSLLCGPKQLSAYTVQDTPSSRSCFCYCGAAGWEWDHSCLRIFIIPSCEIFTPKKCTILCFSI